MYYYNIRTKIGSTIVIYFTKDNIKIVSLNQYNNLTIHFQLVNSTMAIVDDIICS